MQEMLRIALEWAIRCFGWDHMHDNKVRALRTAEESVELAQAIGCTQEQVERLVRVVYSKPAGEPARELSQALMTLNLFCAANGIDPVAAFESELRRVLTKPADEFARRNETKNALGLDGKT